MEGPEDCSAHTLCWNLAKLLREWERRKKESGRWILWTTNLTTSFSPGNKPHELVKRGEWQETTKKIHSSIALNMYEAHGLEIQASLPFTLYCYGPTCLLHPVYQVLDLSAVSAAKCCRTNHSNLNLFQKNQSLILTTVIYSHKYTGQPHDLGWAWMEVATDNLSRVLYPGLVGQPGHVFLMATAEVQSSR